jgi:signal transduction histidine kinase/DNA-binding response OmpR family regulator
MITEIKKLVPEKGAFQKVSSPILDDTHIRLTPNENAIKVQVSLLNFSGLKNNRYAYKLGGDEEEWNYTSQPEIDITNLKYGSQILHIKAQSAEGLPSKNEISLTICRERPFYLKWWFASTCILFCSGLFFYSLYLVRKNRERLELLVEERTKTISNQAKELEQLNEQQSNFFVNVSHELRTPISLILGPLNSLRKEQLSNTQQTNLGIIERNTKRLQLMIDELLAFAKLNTEIAESTQKVIDLQSFIIELSLDYIPLADQKELEFSFNSNIPEDILVILDTEKVNRIAGNLIQNAIKFTPQYGKITLNAILKENTFLFQVIDNGEGIREEDINKIFKRYYQTSKSSDLEGLGVGLSLSKELAETMGGKLTVSSTHQKGSTFNLLIPIEKSVQSIFSSQEASTLNINLPFNPEVAHQPNTSKPSILVVEDHPDMLTYLTSIFEDDYVILKARNGVEAIQLINNMKDSSPSVQLIISDIMMPGINGLQFFHILQHNQSWRNVPFIFLTAKNNPSEKIEALRIGVDDYLTKPFTEEELKARAQNLIQRYTDRIQFTSIVKEAPKTEVENLAETPEWIKDATNIIKVHAHDSLFNVEQLAIKLMMSRRQLFRKMKSTTGLTPNKFMQEVRLQLAKEMLESPNTQSVQEVSLAVGFKKANYFSQLYKDRFGRLPSSYL